MSSDPDFHGTDSDSNFKSSSPSADSDSDFTSSSPDLHCADADFLTQLECACREGKATLVRTLIREHKADVCVLNESDTLSVAALYGKEEVALMLINEFGCDTNVKGALGGSLLHLACLGGNVSLVRTLISDHNTDVNALDNNNDTPLHVAAVCGKEEVALMLTNSVVTPMSRVL